MNYTLLRGHGPWRGPERKFESVFQTHQFGNRLCKVHCTPVSSLITDYRRFGLSLWSPRIIAHCQPHEARQVSRFLKTEAHSEPTDPRMVRCGSTQRSSMMKRPARTMQAVILLHSIAAARAFHPPIRIVLRPLPSSILSTRDRMMRPFPVHTLKQVRDCSPQSNRFV